MTIETYQELFCYTAFPVFAAVRSTGKIVYKNFACKQYLPKISKRNSIHSFIFMPNFQEVGPVKLAEPGVYHTAVALEDGEYSVFLFLSQFQYEDGIYHANRVYRKFGPSLKNFLAHIQIKNPLDIPSAALPDKKSGLYTGTLELLLDERDLGFPLNLSLYQMTNAVFEKLNTSFPELGYRVNARIDEDFPCYLKTSSSLQSVLFVLGRLLYLQIKLSKTKEVNVFLSCDLAYSRNIFHISVKTDLSQLPDIWDEEWLWRIVPECAMEFSLLYQAGQLNKDNFEMKLDSFGNLSLQYRVPYISPETYYVRSMDTDNTFLLRLIDYMLDSIRAKIKDNGASY